MSSSNRSENKWTVEEDGLLMQAVARFGNTNNWQIISTYLPGRTNKNCRKRWVHSLDPSLKRGRWSVEEDQLLRAAVSKEGSCWYKVAKFVPGRTDDQCSKRWREKLCPDISDLPWSSEEDSLLLSLYDTYGTRWNKISKKLPGRPGVVCRNRYQSLLRTRSTRLRTITPHSPTTSASSQCLDSSPPSPLPRLSDRTENEATHLVSPHQTGISDKLSLSQDYMREAFLSSTSEIQALGSPARHSTDTSCSHMSSPLDLELESFERQVADLCAQSLTSSPASESNLFMPDASYTQTQDNFFAIPDSLSSMNSSQLHSGSQCLAQQLNFYPESRFEESFLGCYDLPQGPNSTGISFGQELLLQAAMPSSLACPVDGCSFKAAEPNLVVLWAHIAMMHLGVSSPQDIESLVEKCNVNGGIWALST